MSEKMIVGVSGYMGAGKSALVKNWSSKLDFEIIDADSIAKELMHSDTTIIEKISDTFKTVDNGKIDFVKLGSIVFSDMNQLKKLNEIVHPILINQLNTLSEISSRSILIDCALLPLWGELVDTDFSIWVEVNVHNRLDRLISRTGLSRERCLERIQKQELLYSKPCLSANKWFRVDNNGSIEFAIASGLTLITSNKKCNHE